jgi:tetratricopeptide (TPR) repeat protein
MRPIGRTLLYIVFPLCLFSLSCQDRAGRAFSRALTLARQKRYEQAVGEMRRLLQIAPRSSRAHNALGQIYRVQNLYSQAIEELEKAIEISQTDPIPAYNLAVIYQEMEDYPKADSFFREALRRDSRFTPALYRQGTLSLARGDLDQAKKQLIDFVELEPGNAFGHNNLGCLLWRQGEAVSARESFRRAVELEPALASAWFNLGFAALDASDGKEEGSAALERYLKLRPFALDQDAVRKSIEKPSAPTPATPSAEAALAAAVRCEAAGETANARAKYGEAIALAPGSGEAHYRLARLYDRALGEKMKAIEGYERALDLSPRSAWADAAIARLQSLRGDMEKQLLAKKDLPRPPSASPTPYSAPAPSAPAGRAEDLYRAGLKEEEARRTEQAEACYRQALAVSPDHALTLFHLGRLAAASGRYEEALDLLRKAQAIDASLPAREELGSVCLKLGTAALSDKEFDRAVDWYRQAGTYGKVHEARQGQGTAFQAAYRAEFDRGNYSAAAGHLRSAVEIRPDTASDCLALGDLYAQKLRRPDEARRYYQKYLALMPRGPDADRVRGYVSPSAAPPPAARPPAARPASSPRAPKPTQDHFSLGARYQQQGKTAEAEEEYLIALREKPSLYQAHYNLGVLYSQTGRATDALNAYKRAAQINPNFAPSQLAIFKMYYFRFGMKNLARPYAQKYIQLEPNSSAARELEGWLNK